MPTLLDKAFRDLPIAVLVTTTDGVIVAMNNTANQVFSSSLVINDNLASKLTAEQAQSVLEDLEGIFDLERRVYRFNASKLVVEKETYLNICLFDHTIAHQRLLNAEAIAKHAKDTAASYQKRQAMETIVQDNMNAFEVACSIDAGFGFSVDPNATMIRINPDGVIVECNKALRGFEASEIMGQNTYEHTHPDDMANTTAYHLKILADTRKSVPVYIWLRKKHKNGSYVHVEVIGTYKADENGDRWLNGVERVVSPERMGRMLSSVTDKIPCGVIMIDPSSGFIDMANPHTIDWLKLDRGMEFKSGLSNLKNKVFCEEEYEKLITAVEQKTDQNTDKTVTVKTLQDRVLTFQCKANKNTAAVHSSMVDVRADNTIVWIVNDVTALSNAMEEKNSALIRFMRCTSHDMRTPMQAISLAAHSLSDWSHHSRNELNEENTVDIDTIISSCAVLETIVSNILEFKTIHSMKLNPIIKLVEMGEKVNRIVNVLKCSTLTKDQVKLDCVCDWIGTKQVLVDSQMVDRIILNLVSNALKFTHSGFVRVKCAVEVLSEEEVAAAAVSEEDFSCIDEELSSFGHSLEGQAAVLKLDVIDSGVGMNEDAIAHVGELDFFKGDEGGFGLGTFIVLTYLKLLKGSLNVESTVGVGTTMKVSMPCRLVSSDITSSEVADSSSNPIGTSNSSSVPIETLSSAVFNNTNYSKMTDDEAPNTPLETNGHQGTPRIKRKLIDQEEVLQEGTVLVVEDVNVNRKLVVKTLKRNGYVVDEAENGAIALKMMLAKDYSTVFMDIDMPVMTGDEAVRQYWKQCGDKANHPKIVMLTGNITDVDRNMALNCGAHEFLPKPVVPKQLLDACRYVSSSISSREEVAVMTSASED